MLPILLRYGYIAALFFVTSIFSLTVFGMHLFSTYFLLAEQSIINGIKYTALTKFDETARSLGYQPQQSLVAYMPPKSIDDIIIREAKRFKVSPTLINAIKHCESSGNFTAISSTGAIGLLQIMPANSKRCGIPEFKLHDPESNIACGTKIISENIKNNNNDVISALEEYLGGPRCIGNRCKEGKHYISCVVNNMALKSQSQDGKFL